MTKIKLLLDARRPVAIFLVEQEKNVRKYFSRYMIYHETFDVTPAYAAKDSIVCVVSERNAFRIMIDAKENLKNQIYHKVPFLYLGTGTDLITVANKMDNREELELDFPPEKKPGEEWWNEGDDEADPFSPFGQFEEP